MHKDFCATHRYETLCCTIITFILYSQAAEKFYESCISFYVSVISDICMKNGPPEDDLVDKLIETIFSVAASKDNTNAQTRDLTPFLKLENYDSVPVVRTYILQLLLEHK